MNLINSTVAFNIGERTAGLFANCNGIGIYNNDGTVTARNTIIAGNTSNGCSTWGPDYYGRLDSQGYNLIGITDSFLNIQGNTTGNILNVNAQLGSLADNGGQTLTNALLAGSPAINAGSNALAVDLNNQALTTDQRGTGFPRINNATVDMGAYETLLLPANTTTTITADTPDPSVEGQSVTVSYTVTSAAGTPTGNVTVSDGVNSCSGTVAAGQCSLALTTFGNRTLTATYGGATLFNPSISAGEPHLVNAVPPVVTENPLSQTKVVGEAVTFTSRGGVFSQTAPDSLASGESLLPGQFLISPNYGYQLIYQPDGNLVLYRGDGTALWSSGTSGHTPGHAIMQTDGNFVIYDSGGNVQFSIGTFGNPGATLALQTDGNVVIYNQGNPIFATGTSYNYPIPTVQWQVSTNGGANFTDIGGSTTPILSFTAQLADNGKQYRAVFTNAFGVGG